MRTFLYAILLGGGLGAGFGILLVALAAPHPDLGGLLFIAVIGGFFGGKFGAIGWAILAGVRLLSASVVYVERHAEHQTIDGALR